MMEGMQGVEGGGAEGATLQQCRLPELLTFLHPEYWEKGGVGLHLEQSGVKSGWAGTESEWMSESQAGAGSVWGRVEAISGCQELDLHWLHVCSGF